MSDEIQLPPVPIPEPGPAPKPKHPGGRPGRWIVRIDEVTGEQWEYDGLRKAAKAIADALYAIDGIQRVVNDMTPNIHLAARRGGNRHAYGYLWRFGRLN